VSSPTPTDRRLEAGGPAGTRDGRPTDRRRPHFSFLIEFADIWMMPIMLLTLRDRVDRHPMSKRDAPMPPDRAPGVPPHQAALMTVRTVHTVVWFSIEACMGYLLVAGFARRTDRWAAAAGAVVAGESLVFVANGFRCPLTAVAESLGAERGSVTDIYLPGWFAHRLPVIHVPLVLLALLLHGRNLRARYAARLPQG
jgi:hypothetical protein